MSLTNKDLNYTFPITVTCDNLIANVVKVGITCKEYPTIPRKVEIIIDKIGEICSKNFERLSDGFSYKEFDSYNSLEKWLYENITSIPEIQELNLTPEEYLAEIKVDDPNREHFVFTSAYSKRRDGCDDFMGLDAFTRNLTHELIKEELTIDFSSFTGTGRLPCDKSNY